jgi:hypothetical protein
MMVEGNNFLLPSAGALGFSWRPERICNLARFQQVRRVELGDVATNLGG